MARPCLTAEGHCDWHRPMPACRARKVVVGLTGMPFIVSEYRLLRLLRQEPALAMMLSLYVTLGGRDFSATYLTRIEMVGERANAPAEHASGGSASERSSCVFVR